MNLPFPPTPWSASTSGSVRPLLAAGGTWTSAQRTSPPLAKETQLPPGLEAAQPTNPRAESKAARSLRAGPCTEGAAPSNNEAKASATPSLRMPEHHASARRRVLQ
jgi:hypothetical protein